MITKTTLSNPIILARIYWALRNAVKASYKGPMNAPVTLYNRKGKPYMMVWHVRTNSVDGHVPGFVIQDMFCNNITGTVFSALRNQ